MKFKLGKIPDYVPHSIERILLVAGLVYLSKIFMPPKIWGFVGLSPNILDHLSPWLEILFVLFIPYYLILFCNWGWRKWIDWKYR